MFQSTVCTGADVSLSAELLSASGAVAGAGVTVGCGDENGNDIVYEYQGEEYLAAQMDYTLGKILEKHID